MDLKELKNKLLEDKNFAEEYEKADLAMEIGLSITNARIQKGLTQKQLAHILKTKQPSIARIENGVHLPSMRFLAKIAKALNIDLAPKFTQPIKIYTYNNKGTQDSLNNVLISEEVPLELVHINAQYSDVARK